MIKTLLPTGCYDLLPPHARQAGELSSALLAVFERYGYEQVAPPLLEYSESLLAGRGGALSGQIFRVMDPGAHKVMGIRADITPQIARIAAGRLAHAPRPMRLSYNGMILRMKGEQQYDQQLWGDRQLRQAGIELIGAASPEADAEVIHVAAEALRHAGIETLSIDLNLPGIVGSLLASEKLDNEQAQRLFAAVAHKDVSGVAALSFGYRDTLIGLMQCAGPAEAALAAMRRLELPESARRQMRDLEEVVSLLKSTGRDGWSLSIDPTENRGLAYHSGISFSIFVPGAAREVGRGGRYRIEGATAQDDMQATGFTVYVETLRSLLPEPQRGKRAYIAEGVTAQGLDALHAQGFATVLALPGAGEDAPRKLGCTHVYENNALKEVI